MNVLLSVEYACSTSLHPCHPNAACIDVFGLLGFVQCKCKPGYNQTASYQTFANNRSIIPDGTYCPLPAADLLLLTSTKENIESITNPVITKNPTTEKVTSFQTDKQNNFKFDFLTGFIIFGVLLFASLITIVLLVCQIRKNGKTTESNQATSDKQSKSHNLVPSKLSVIREKTCDAPIYITMEGKTSNSKNHQAPPGKPSKPSSLELSIIHEKAEGTSDYVTMADQPQGENLYENPATHSRSD
ncbi:unnamed protein product [Clavelina lepadiformis]|uniref:EGF-like domain-containing protein n=1 Tax=Clavelina lepadiformis TaxID=159417 RepID=A0ABP0GJJ2_CLALP